MQNSKQTEEKIKLYTTILQFYFLVMFTTITGTVTKAVSDDFGKSDFDYPLLFLGIITAGFLFTISIFTFKTIVEFINKL
jgi:hypothetical protein